ncbi:MAG: YdeI/OmpD-associated family protein [Flavisolibacter sp.]
MIRFEATIQKFGQQGEKTGWSYIEISAEQAELLSPGQKTSFRVKGKLDKMGIEKTALLPMGDGRYILALNGDMRRQLKKQKGDVLLVQLAKDNGEIELSPELLACLDDEPAAKEFFQSLPRGHRNYFSKWIESAKTEPTKAKRIALAVNALAKGWGYSEMIRNDKKDRSLL